MVGIGLQEHYISLPDLFRVKQMSFIIVSAHRVDKSYLPCIEVPPHYGYLIQTNQKKRYQTNQIKLKTAKGSNF